MSGHTADHGQGSPGYGLRNEGSARAAAILVAMTMLGACGIQDIPFYSPPTVDAGGSANSFVMTHNVLNYDPTSAIQYFVGYELYYRVYTNESDAASAVTNVQAEVDSADGSPSIAFSKMESLGFKRCYNADNPANPFDDRPILKDFDLTSAKYFTVYLRDLENWFYISEGANPEILANRHYISRYPSGTTGSQPFYLASGYNTGDIDYASNYSSPDTIYITFFGVAYGQDSQSPLTIIPSYPQYVLGTSSGIGYFTYSPD